jgi:hypothetical protein
MLGSALHIININVPPIVNSHLLYNRCWVLGPDQLHFQDSMQNEITGIFIFKSLKNVQPWTAESSTNAGPVSVLGPCDCTGDMPMMQAQLGFVCKVSGLKRSSKNQIEPGMVGYTCNLSYSGSGDQEDHSSRPTLYRKLARPPITTNKLGMVAQICHPSYVGGKGRKIAI